MVHSGNLFYTMRNYRMNKNTSDNPRGNNEVHNEDCEFYNQIYAFVDLGFHSGCATAVAKAKQLGYPKADGCKTYSSYCHNG